MRCPLSFFGVMSRFHSRVRVIVPLSLPILFTPESCLPTVTHPLLKWVAALCVTMCYGNRLAATVAPSLDSENVAGSLGSLRASDTTIQTTSHRIVVMSINNVAIENEILARNGVCCVPGFETRGLDSGCG
jgi:hypothetical protein